jgi:hypothetical protein
MRNFVLYCLLLGTFCGCASFDRGCSNFTADSFGSDWVVTKSDYLGNPYRCWVLTNTSITNEKTSDGIYWKSSGGHLVHIAGNYDRVQVVNGNWTEAFLELGLTQETCAKVSARQYDPESKSYLSK